MARGRSPLPVSQADRLRLFATRGKRLWLLALVASYLLIPLNVDDFWLDVLARCGIAAIGAIGLNLLTGYTGQISLGHAFFLGVGAYVGAWFGVQQSLPLVVWLPLAALIGGALGAVIGPFALRLRGDYLAIITLGLLYVGQFVFDKWTSLTGGGRGTSTAAPAAIGPFDFGKADLFGRSYSRAQGMFWLVWLIVAVVALLATNLVRSRAGRAMQAIRDRDVAAEVIGVSLARYKIGAFAVSSAMAAAAGGLFGVLQQHVSPDLWGGPQGLALSITYVAMIIVGGIGTIYGSVLGGIVVAFLPRWIERFGQHHHIPLVKSGASGSGYISVFALNQMIFGLLIIVFLLVEARGLAALWARVKGYLRTWPFPY